MSDIPETMARRAGEAIVEAIGNGECAIEGYVEAAFTSIYLSGLVDALRFYADLKTYITPPSYRVEGADYDFGPVAPIKNDMGRTARDALHTALQKAGVTP